jgi:hypothetical protein
MPESRLTVVLMLAACGAAAWYLWYTSQPAASTKVAGTAIAAKPHAYKADKGPSMTEVADAVSQLAAAQDLQEEHVMNQQQTVHQLTQAVRNLTVKVQALEAGQDSLSYSIADVQAYLSSEDAAADGDDDVDQHGVTELGDATESAAIPTELADVVTELTVPDVTPVQAAAAAVAAATSPQKT